MQFPSNHVAFYDDYAIDGVISLKHIYNSSIFITNGHYNKVKIIPEDRYFKLGEIVDHDRIPIEPFTNNTHPKYDSSWIGV